MSEQNVIRAWKDPEYRAGLGAAERALLPEHPAGLVDLDHAELAAAGGGMVNTQDITAALTVSLALSCFPGCK